ncbi:reverse transcriptase-like protein, partial [Nocardia farcinica]|nr:reverse transcriptase-like protein [Nocardia farcinica]
KGATLAMEHGVYDLVVVGDSRIAIQQAQGLINCHQPNLLSEFDSVRQKFQSVKLIHVKREFNQAADYLTSRTLAAGESLVIDDPLELSHLRL